MEGVLLDIEVFESSILAMAGLVVLVLAACAILLGYIADEEARGEQVFWAESPFTEIGEAPPAEGVKYPRAA